MNHNLLIDCPLAYCILPADHPARAHIPASQTNIRATFELHHLDDWELTTRLEYLTQPEDYKP